MRSTSFGGGWTGIAMLALAAACGRATSATEGSERSTLFPGGEAGSAALDPAPARPQDSSDPVEGVATPAASSPEPAAQGPRHCWSQPILTQAALDELRDCEIFDGSLSIMMREADLSPLHLLTRVEGGFAVLSPDEKPAIDSLAGLERLEYIGGIASFSGLRIATLAPLRSLRQVGELHLSGMSELVNLDGLQALELQDLLLDISGAPKLQTLSPLVFPAHMSQRLLVRETPSLTSLGEVSQLESLVNLQISGTALKTLRGLEQLRDVQILEVHHNPLLEEVSALAQLHSTEFFTVANNPLLRALPVFSSLERAGAVYIVENAVLESAGSYPRVARLSGDWSGELQVRNNPLLPSLEGFSSLQQADVIRIQSNASLSQIAFPALLSVSRSLVVTSNPVLDGDTASQLGAVQAPIAKIEGNQSPPLLLDPCPWTNDSICDEAPDDVLCAPGTDAADCPVPL